MSVLAYIGMSKKDQDKIWERNRRLAPIRRMEARRESGSFKNEEELKEYCKRIDDIYILEEDGKKITKEICNEFDVVIDYSNSPYGIYIIKEENI